MAATNVQDFSGDVQIRGTTFIKANTNNDNLAIGTEAGLTGQGQSTVAVGEGAGQTSQANNSVAVGRHAGQTSQASNSVAVGNQAGNTSQGFTAIAIGVEAGETTQGVSAIAVGNQAGELEQNNAAVAIGTQAGQTTQKFAAVAVGRQAGQTTQGASAVAVGNQAGNTSQGNNSIAVGTQAGETSQGNFAVAIGRFAGQASQGASSVAIGHQAGKATQPANSIILNATGEEFNPTTASSFHVKPVRGGNFAASALAYTADGEIVEETGTHFDASGNVGIGKTDPGAALDVLGTIRVQTGTNDATGGEFSIDTNVGHIRRKVAGNGVSLTSYDDFYFYVNATGGSAEDGTQAMIIDSAGSVGIGTTNPGAPLHIGDYTTGSAGELLRLSGASTADRHFKFLNEDDGVIGGTGANAIWVHDINSSFGQYAFRTSNTELMRIKNDGNVGIGTTSPQARLHVYPSSGSDVEVALLNFAPNFAEGYLGITATATHTNAVGADLRFKGRVYVSTGVGSDREVMCLKPTGNVGIGTTNPENQLHLFKAANDQTSGLFIEKQNGGTGTAQITFGVAASSEAAAGKAKAGIFFERNSSNGRGDLKFCNDFQDDANNVGVADCALKITKQGYVQPGQINLGFSGIDGSLGGNYLFQAIYNAYRSGGQTGGTMTATFQRHIQVCRMGSLISIRGYLPSRQSTSTNLNYRFTWAELGLDGQRSGNVALVNKSTSTYGTWSDTITSDATYLTLTSTGQSLSQSIVNYNSLIYLIDVGWIAKN